MADERRAAIAKAGLGAAAVITFASILFFGRNIENATESAAECMESTHSLRDCDHPRPAEFWEPVVILAGLSFLVGAVCFIYGQSFRAKT